MTIVTSSEIIMILNYTKSDYPKLIKERLSEFLEKTRDSGITQISDGKLVDDKLIYTAKIGSFVVVFIVKKMQLSRYSITMKVEHPNETADVCRFFMNNIKDSLVNFLSSVRIV